MDMSFSHVKPLHARMSRGSVSVRVSVCFVCVWLWVRQTEPYQAEPKFTLPTHKVCLFGKDETSLRYSARISNFLDPTSSLLYNSRLTTRPYSNNSNAMRDGASDAELKVVHQHLAMEGFI
jgi:hypothetical protein